jgi:hypothetical protein
MLLVFSGCGGDAGGESSTSLPSGSIVVDTDNDGIADSLDSDDDNDGIADNLDAFPLDTTKYTTSSTSNSIFHNGYGYGVITSSVTSRIWLDRNLGAVRSCTGIDDKACYGDYYQWGRATDGHQKQYSYTTTLLSSSIDTSGNKFIINTTDPYDWTTIDNTGSLRSTAWSKTDGNSVCPANFRVPTKNEFDAEGFNNRVEAYNVLKFPSAGFQGGWTDTQSIPVESEGIVTYLLTSESLETEAYRQKYDSTSSDISTQYRINGYSVRCILDDNVALTDTDGDGTPDISDTDDDNDGVLDVDDAYPLDATKSIDVPLFTFTDINGTWSSTSFDSAGSVYLTYNTNASGIYTAGDINYPMTYTLVNNILQVTLQGSTTLSLDGNISSIENGVMEFDINYNGSIGITDNWYKSTKIITDSSTTDTDGDGIPDITDTDDDNDGVLDVNDVYPLDASRSELDTDNDGVADSLDAFPNDPNETLDSDGDGTGNNADLDDDNDGVLDVDDAYPLDPTQSVAQSYTVRSFSLPNLYTGRLVIDAASMILDSARNVHVTWIENNDTTKVMSIYYAKFNFDNPTLANKKVIYTSDPYGIAASVEITVDNTDNPHISFFIKRNSVDGTRDGNYAVMYSDTNSVVQVSDNPTSYVDLDSLYNSYVNDKPTITINASGVVEIYYIADANTLTSYDNYIVKATKNGSSWTKTQMANPEGTYGTADYHNISADYSIASSSRQYTSLVLGGIDMEDYLPFYYYGSSNPLTNKNISTSTSSFANKDVSVESDENGVNHIFWSNSDNKQILHYTVSNSGTATYEDTAQYDTTKSTTGNLTGATIDYKIGTPVYMYREYLGDNILTYKRPTDIIYMHKAIPEIVGKVCSKRSISAYNNEVVSITCKDDGTLEFLFIDLSQQN